jgi:hypothetical protein
LRPRQLAPKFQEAHQIRDRRFRLVTAQAFLNTRDDFVQSRQSLHRLCHRLFQSFSFFHVSPRLLMLPEDFRAAFVSRSKATTAMARTRAS